VIRTFCEFCTFCVVGRLHCNLRAESTGSQRRRSGVWLPAIRHRRSCGFFATIVEFFASRGAGCAA